MFQSRRVKAGSACAPGGLVMGQVNSNLCPQRFVVEDEQLPHQKEMVEVIHNSWFKHENRIRFMNQNKMTNTRSRWGGVFFVGDVQKLECLMIPKPAPNSGTARGPGRAHDTCLLPSVGFHGVFHFLKHCWRKCWDSSTEMLTKLGFSGGIVSPSWYTLSDFGVNCLYLFLKVAFC